MSISPGCKRSGGFLWLLHAGLPSVARVHFDLPTSGAHHHAHPHLLRSAREHAAASFARLWRLFCSVTALHNCESLPHKQESEPSLFAPLAKLIREDCWEWFIFQVMTLTTCYPNSSFSSCR